MRTLLSFVGVIVLVPGLVQGQDDAGKKEQTKLQGVWLVVSSEEDGRATPDFIVQNLKLEMKGNQITLKGVEDLMKKFGKVTFKLDPSSMPKFIDFKVEAGSEKNSEYEGIYELKGDELRICASVVSRNRPDEFKTKEGSNRVLFVLKRDKK